MSAKPCNSMNFIEALAVQACQTWDARRRPFLIAICGGADTGKSTLARALCDAFKRKTWNADCLSTDEFLKDRKTRIELGLSGFDPAAVDVYAMTRAIKQLSRGSPLTYFPYLNKTGTHSPHAMTIEVGDIVVVEGIHAFHPAVASLMDYRLFIDAQLEMLRELRIQANVKKRAMDADEATRNVDFEMQEFMKYTAPTKRIAQRLISVSRTYDYVFNDPSS